MDESLNGCALYGDRPNPYIVGLHRHLPALFLVLTYLRMPHVVRGRLGQADDTQI